MAVESPFCSSWFSTLLIGRIAKAEGAAISDDALALITRASEGSARDATSLLDQAISHGAGETSADQVRAMLGLADRGRVLDLFELIMKGDAAAALAELSAQYADGADPMAVLRDLAEITHWISVIKVTPEAVNDPTISPDERARGQGFAEGLPMRALTRMWQMLLVALEEVAAAPNAMMAAEMAVIRLTHVADLPTPEELVRKLRDTPPPPAPNPGGTGRTPAGASAATAGGGSAQNSAPIRGKGEGGSSGPTASLALAETPESAQETALAHYQRFDDVIGLIRARRDVKLLVEVESSLRLASYMPGRIEFTPTDTAPRDLAARLASRLQAWTGIRWGVTLVNDCTTATIAEQQGSQDLALKDKARAHPLVQAAIAAFPTATITNIRSPEDLAAVAAQDALPEVEDEWDPFEEG